ncbi:MAG: hypothetical protein WBC91_19380 [Phototrophicaceae bacterium]
MKTSADVIKQLQEAVEKSQAAQQTLENLIAVHDYQDVAALVMQSSEALLHATIAFLQSDDKTALDLVESAEDLLEDMYNVIDGDLDL